jgi:hypothetical protein
VPLLHQLELQLHQLLHHRARILERRAGRDGLIERAFRLDEVPQIEDGAEQRLVAVVIPRELGFGRGRQTPELATDFTDRPGVRQRPRAGATEAPQEV